jgi:DNA polymerase-3 subunit alpha
MFTHLHVHTEYSELDGLGKIEDLILRAKELGQTAIAITDHGSTSGLYEAYKLSMKHNFKVLYGSEFYFENAGEERKAGHIILIAKNNKGLENLFQLQAKAYMDNFYYKPRINMEMLKEHSEGLICLSACVANQIAQYVLQSEFVLALQHLKDLQNIFGEDFYLELQSSTLDDVITVNKKYEEWILDGIAKPVLTNDVHYVLKEDHYPHDVLLCIQQNAKLNDEKRWRFETHDYWLKSEAEMMADVSYLGVSVVRDAIQNTQEIVDKCNVDLSLLAGNFLPHYKGMNKDEEDEALSDLTMERYINRVVTRDEGNQDFLSDIYKELAVIQQTGYSGYFLIVQEYINWAKSNGILVGDGRGSGAGSKVAYTIGITEVNPQRYDLLFERFLSPGREPDFDVDFSDIDAVFKHLQDEYGERNVARVGAVTKLTAKSALKKVLSVYGFSSAESAKIIGLLPQRLSFSLEEAINESPELAKFFAEHTDIHYVTTKLENKLDHLSTHAGGVIICNNLTSILPIVRDKKNNTKMVIGLDKKVLEELGHYKFDILGLESLKQIDGTLRNIADKIDWYEVDLEDQNIYDMLCSGDVLGVFQLSDQQEKVVQQQPRSFEDLIAINALIRPGVGDWNEYLRRRSTNDYGTLGERHGYLRNTAGIIVYQEQYLLLARDYAGWDIAYSDKYIRKNKDIRNDHELHNQFIWDSQANGYELEEIEKVWALIVEAVAGGYGFNRSHATSYAVLAFQTAYLKYYYPTEFYASLLTMDGGDSEKIMQIKLALDKLKIKLLPPDINKSTNEFIPTKEGIRYRLSSVDSVGGSALYEIERLKPITSLKDFLERRTPKFVKINAIEQLIKAGCFDGDGLSRFALLSYLNENTKGDLEVIEAPNYVYEKQALGLYLSEAPYDKYDTYELNTYNEGSVVVTVGEVLNVKTVFDKKGNEMAFTTIANKHGTIRCVVFASVWEKTKELWQPGNMIMINGKKDKTNILVNTVERLEN